MKDKGIDITGIGRITPTGLLRGKDIKSAAVLDALSEATPGGKLPDIPLDGSYPSSRRMDKYSRLAMTAIALALEDASLDTWTDKRNIGIISSTTYGCLNTDFDYFDTVLPDAGIGASPGLFSYTLPSSFMGDVAIRFGLTGPGFVIQEKSASALTCLKLALNAIYAGDTEKMVCGVCHPEPPPVYNNIIRIPAGALFMVLEKIPANGFSYGRVSLDKAGFITLNGDNVNDLNAIVRQCLTSKYPLNDRHRFCGHP